MMTQTLINKISFLIFFLLIYIFALKNFILKDYLYIILAIYGVTILSLKIIFSNYFLKLNFEKKIIFFLIFLIFSFFLSFDYFSFLLFISFSYFLIYKFDLNNIIFYALGLFFVFFFLWFLEVDIKLYSIFYVFSFYFFIIGILYFIFNSIKINFEKLKYNYRSLYIYIIIVNFLFLLIIFYYSNTIYYYIFFTFLNIIFYVDFDKDLLNIFTLKYQDFFIFFLFIIIMIPFVSDYLVFKEKNIILLITFTSFFILYLGFKLIFKTIKKE